MDLVYPFSSEFVTGLLSLVLTDRSYGFRALTSLDPAMMPTAVGKKVFSALHRGCLELQCVPSIAYVRQQLHQQHVSGAFDAETLQAADKLIDVALRTRALAREEVHSVLKDAVLQTSLSDALRSALRAYRSGEYATCKSIVDSAYDAARGLEIGSIGRSMRHQLDEYVRDVRDGKAYVHRIPTGIYELDSKIKGGLGRGELGCWLGGRKAGKSMLLCYIAATAVLCGLNVVYITLELPKLEVENRISCCIVGMEMDDISYRTDQASRELRTKLSAVFADGAGTYIVKKFPPKTITVRDIEMYLRDVKAFYDIDVDVLIVDYADDMLASTKAGNADSYTKGDHIYGELKALGSSTDSAYGIDGGFDCAVWTVSQVQRDAMDHTIITMDKVDKSIDKASKVDFLGSICKDQDDMEAFSARLYIAACRYAPGNRGVEHEIGPFKQEESKGRFFDVEEAERERSIATWIESTESVKSQKTQQQKKLRLLKVCAPLNHFLIGGRVIR